MRSVTRLFLLCALGLAYAACKGEPADPWDEKFIRADLEERGPKDLRNAVEDQPEYTPREDYEKRASIYSEMAARQDELRAEQKKLWPGTMANRKLLAPYKAKLLELDPRLLYAANY